MYSTINILYLERTVLLTLQ